MYLASQTKRFVGRSYRPSVALPERVVFKADKDTAAEQHPPGWRRPDSPMQRVGSRQLHLRPGVDRTLERLDMEPGTRSWAEVEFGSLCRSQHITT